MIKLQLTVFECMKVIVVGCIAKIFDDLLALIITSSADLAFLVRDAQNFKHFDYALLAQIQLYS